MVGDRRLESVLSWKGRNMSFERSLGISIRIPREPWKLVLFRVWLV